MTHDEFLAWLREELSLVDLFRQRVAKTETQLEKPRADLMPASHVQVREQALAEGE